MNKRLRFMADLIEPLLVTPGRTVELGRDFDPGYTGQVKRAQAGDLLAEGVELVLQGLDASGQDSTIKHMMSGVNPPPDPAELAEMTSARAGLEADSRG